jgi:hypothetical protein
MLSNFEFEYHLVKSPLEDIGYIRTFNFFTKPGGIFLQNLRKLFLV